MERKNRKLKLRYGENPSQEAYLLNHSNKTILSYQISGKKELLASDNKKINIKIIL